MTNLDSIIKSRDIALPTKVRLVKAMVFLVVMYGCESWTVKKAERWRIDAFKPWCWRRLLRVPWTARRSSQSILKEISPGISLEGMMLRLKLKYFGQLMRGVDSLEKTDAGRDWGQEKKGMTEDEMAGWHHWLNGRESEWTPGVGEFLKSRTRVSDWTERHNKRLLESWIPGQRSSLRLWSLFLKIYTHKIYKICIFIQMHTITHISIILSVYL